MGVGAESDFLALAITHPRQKFVASCPFPFLVGRASTIRPSGPQPTMIGSISGTAPIDAPILESAGNAVTIHAVRKVQTSFPTMITIGRTSNNDIIVNDVQISKFHAFFRTVDGKTQLVDTGSRNGTWLGQTRVTKAGADIKLGDMVRLARLEFLYVDAGECWDAARRLMRPAK
jgi:hypothetical protein